MAEMEWKPIASAPKDGTAVWIAGDDFSGIGYCEAANWLHDKDRWTLKARVERKTADQPADGVYCTHRVVTPTAWMPLPSTAVPVDLSEWCGQVLPSPPKE
jgi:hypothetical protein